MGWKRRGSKPVELRFEFGSRRLFTRINVFASNRLDLNIQVFKRATVRIGDDDLTPFEYMSDHALQQSRNVSIPVRNGAGALGSSVTISLSFSNIWLLVSEVTFESRELTPTEENELLDVQATTEAAIIVRSSATPMMSTVAGVRVDHRADPGDFDEAQQEDEKDEKRAIKQGNYVIISFVLVS